MQGPVLRLTSPPPPQRRELLCIRPITAYYLSAMLRELLRDRWYMLRMSGILRGEHATDAFCDPSFYGVDELLFN